MFDVGREYTREEIHAHVGGSLVSYLPTKQGSVVAACLTKRLNPQAPNVIICGNGPQIASAGEALSLQAYAIPVFLKRAVNRWEYQGLFKPARSYTSGPELESHVQRAGRPRAEVTRVVIMEVVADAA
jgi:hypothetical protein